MADHPFLDQFPRQIRNAIAHRFWLAADLESRTPGEVIRTVTRGSAWAAEEASIPEEHPDALRESLRTMHEHDELALDYAAQVLREVKRQAEGAGGGSDGG